MKMNEQEKYMYEYYKNAVREMDKNILEVFNELELLPAIYQLICELKEDSKVTDESRKILNAVVDPGIKEGTIEKESEKVKNMVAKLVEYVYALYDVTTDTRIEIIEKYWYEKRNLKKFIFKITQHCQPLILSLKEIIRIREISNDTLLHDLVKRTLETSKELRQEVFKLNSRNEKLKCYVEMLAMENEKLKERFKIK